MRMRHANSLVLLCALLIVSAAPVHAAPGDVVVPAHRTKDGHWVPANVPPASGGTHLAHRPARGKAVHRQAQAPQTQQLLPPLLVEAQPIRR